MTITVKVSVNGNYKATVKHTVEGKVGGDGGANVTVGSGEEKVLYFEHGKVNIFEIEEEDAVVYAAEAGAGKAKSANDLELKERIPATEQEKAAEQRRIEELSKRTGPIEGQGTSESATSAAAGDKKMAEEETVETAKAKAEADAAAATAAADKAKTDADAKAETEAAARRKNDFQRKPITE